MTLRSRHPNTTILGLGAYIPPEVRTNSFWPESLVESWQNSKHGRLLNIPKQEAETEFRHPALLEELKKIEGDPFVGMKERRVSRVSPSVMEKEACLEALEDAKLNPKDIDLFIGFSLPPNRFYPPNVYRLHSELGLANARCFEMNAICHSFLMMLEVVSQYVAAGTVRNALVFVSTTYSALMDYSTSISVPAGDGAAAVVLGACPMEKGVLASYNGFETAFHDSMIVRNRPMQRAATPEFDFGESQSAERMFFTINEPQKAKEIISRIPKWGEDVKRKLLGDRFHAEDINLFVTNAAMAWYSAVLCKIFGIATDKLEDNIQRFSNMGAVNLPMNLYTAYKNNRIREGDMLLLFGHGGGASYGGALLRWFQKSVD